MPSRPQRFVALIRKQGPNPYVKAPAAVSACFAEYARKGYIQVYGTLEKAEIRGNLTPRGGGHWLFLHAGMRAFAGVGVGDSVELVLRAVPWDHVPIAEDCKAALENADGARKSFEAMSPSQRRELLRWVDAAESAGQRAKRIAVMVDQIRGRSPAPLTDRAVDGLKPLWTCPQCGHVFVNPHQWHSCKRYTLQQALSRGSPRVRRLFECLRQKVASLGPARVQAYRDHVSFLVRVRFIQATPKKNWLDVAFWLPRRIDSPRFRKVESLTPSDHVHILRITEEDQLDKEVMAWVREGYTVGEQRRHGSSRSAA